MEAVLQDIRYAVRQLARSPAFTAVAVLTLALGIGANTAIFSVIDALMLRHLPVDHPEELVTLTATRPGDADEAFSYAAYTLFREEAARFADVVAVTRSDRASIAVAGEPELVYRKSVSGNYFSALHVPAALGRTLLAEDDRSPGGQPVAVLNYAYWTRRFGGDPTILGRTFTFKETAFTIVGVAPRGFFGETVGEAPDVWTPLTVQPGAPAWLWKGHSTTWLRLLARRRPGVTLAQARAVLDPLFERVTDEIAGETSDPQFRQQVRESRLGVANGSHGLSELRRRFSRPLGILMVVVGLVLLIACANLANLLLARAAARRREMGIRLAIGAGRLRLVRQLLAESLVLAGVGGGLAVMLANWSGAILVALPSRGPAPIPLDVGPDARVLAFTAAVALVTAIAFGLAPALRAARLDLLSAMKEPSGGGRSTARIPLGRALVIAQMALSVLLLVAAALFIKSLGKIRSIETGFEPDRVLLVKLAAPAVRDSLPEAELRRLYGLLLERAKSVPGVRAASLSFSGVFSRGTWGNQITVEGQTAPPGVVLRTLANAVSPGYFQVTGIPVLRGRTFVETDDERAPRVAVVNQAFARRFFGGADPIGRRVGLVPAQDPMEIVGLVQDAKYADLREAPAPMLYVPYTQYPSQLRELEVRTAGDLVAVAAGLRRELAAVDPRLPVLDLLRMNEQIDASIAPERLIAKLSSVFGLLALALASVGLYGVMSYVVAQRTAEVGIRIALGADAGAVLRLVLRDMLPLVLGGIVIGVPAALVGGRFISSLLYGLSPRDPIAITIAIVILSAVAVVAGWLPARRATRVDPVVALR